VLPQDPGLGLRTARPVAVDHQPEAPATLNEVQYAINFFEEIGVLFNLRKIDRDQVIRHFGSAFVSAFDRAWWWVHWRRHNRVMAAKAGEPAHNETETYAEWQRMVCTILDRRPDTAPEGKPGDKTWILCLPGGRPSQADVVRHEQLSSALTGHCHDLTGLRARLDGEFGPWQPAFAPVTGVLCVPRWDDRGHQLELQRLACRLTAALAADNGFARLAKIAA
jgi:hypothetical protein